VVSAPPTAAIQSEMRQLALMYPTIVETLGDFSIPGDGGVWVGEIGFGDRRKHCPAGNVLAHPRLWLDMTDGGHLWRKQRSPTELPGSAE
jgi:hypothetical protein